MATTTTRPARRRAPSPKRVVRHARAKAATARRTVEPIASRTGRRIGIISLIAVGTLIALGTAAFVAAAVDPRADAMLRRGLRDAREALDDLPSRLPDVSLPSNFHRLDSLARQISDAGQRLAGLVRAAAHKF